MHRIFIGSFHPPQFHRTNSVRERLWWQKTPPKGWKRWTDSGTVTEFRDMLLLLTDFLYFFWCCSRMLPQGSDKNRCVFVCLSCASGEEDFPKCPTVTGRTWNISLMKDQEYRRANQRETENHSEASWTERTQLSGYVNVSCDTDGSIFLFLKRWRSAHVAAHMWPGASVLTAAANILTLIGGYHGALWTGAAPWLLSQHERVRCCTEHHEPVSTDCITANS